MNFAKFLQKDLRATTAMPIYLLQNLQGHLSVGQSVFFFEKYLMTFRFQFHKGLILIFSYFWGKRRYGFFSKVHRLLSLPLQS